MIPAILRNPILIAAIVGIVALSFTGAIGTAAIGNVPAPESKEYGGYKGVVELKGGRGNTGTEYVASWDREGFSETVTLSGTVQRAKIVTCNTPQAVRYNVFLDDYHVYTSPEYRLDGFDSMNTVNVPTATWSFKGNANGDHVLKATLEAKIAACFSTTPEWRHLATDGAKLLDGAASIKLDGQTDRFAEGETATFLIETGAGGPWKLAVYRGTGELSCGIARGELRTAAVGPLFWGSGWPKTPGYDPVLAQCAVLTWAGEFDGKVKFTIPAGTFRSDGKNTWKAVLTNEVFKRGEERLFTIDNSRLAPEVPTVTATPDEPSVGETVVVKISSRANPTSKSPISRYVVTAWYGQADRISTAAEDLIMSNFEAAARPNGDRYEAEVQFRVDKSAKAHIRVTAIDAAGRPSGSIIDSRQVQELEDAGLDEPNANGRVTVDTQGAPSNVGLGLPGKTTDAGLVILALIVTAILAAAAYYFLPMPGNLRIAAAAIVAIGGLAWTLGVVA